MSELYGFDAFAPREVARRVAEIGVTKARMPFLQLAMLGVLAGAFIGLGALFSTIVFADSSLGLAASRVLGGLTFSLGLTLVVIAGAELFTGNNLLAMAWADRRISSAEVLRNWAIVCAANFVGAAGLALLVFASGHAAMGGGAIGRTVVALAKAKTELPFGTAFFRGVLCNVLVCLAVWMALAGRSVVDRIVAIVLPVAAFVAAGFEHSIANMYLIPLAMLLTSSWGDLPPVGSIGLTGLVSNLVPVILGNLVGGSVFVALVYHVIYRRGVHPPESEQAPEGPGGPTRREPGQDGR